MLLSSRRVPLRYTVLKRFYRPVGGQFGYLQDEVKPKSSNEIPECDPKEHLTNAYRRYGFLAANLDLLGMQRPVTVPELNPKVYGLANDPGVDDLVNRLQKTYSGPIAIELMHINVHEERQWLAENYEEILESNLESAQKVKLLKLLIRAENFERFLALKFPMYKRYSCEGGESAFAFYMELFDSAPEMDIREIVFGLVHRGKLAFVNEMMKCSTVHLFRTIREKQQLPDHVQGVGDMPQNLPYVVDHKTKSGMVHVTSVPTPCHLEAIQAVAMGKARARSRTLSVGEFSKDRNARVGDGVLCAVVHGDGSFTGQGVVYETLSLSQVPYFRIGGTIHLILNNQVAFTAEANHGRSTLHCTDLAKAFECPVIHVNGDYPEEVLKATRLALAYREKYRKDVFINLMCYRRWGHNELDDPTFTQPVMYKAVQNRETVPDIYAKRLTEEGLITSDEIRDEQEKHNKSLLEALREVDKSEPVANHLEGHWKGLRQAPFEILKYDTGCDLDLLKFIGAASVSVPKEFNLHPHLKKIHCDGRINKLINGHGIDWGTAEALAFGITLLQGNDVRISGQDVGRGTFSHRHVMFVDQENDNMFVPLNHISDDQKGFLEVANNLLSEEAILGFEYGYSIENPRRLCIWEAQFGDFANGAQIMIDNYMATGEGRWLLQSGLTLLLPHGIDGAGPEHSSCRIERFLHLCDSKEIQNPVDGENVNIRIANPTTSANYFHLLRKQVVPDYRKPLVVVAPKVLLRHSKATSDLSEFGPGTSFQEVIEDKVCSPNTVEKVIFTSGKHWIAVEQACTERGMRDKLAIVRVESLCPFPTVALREVLKRYRKGKCFIWAQEEPRNAGAWSFVKPRFESGLGISLKYAGRPEIPWTATAVGEIHAREATAAIEEVFQ